MKKTLFTFLFILLAFSISCDNAGGGAGGKNDPPPSGGTHFNESCGAPSISLPAGITINYVDGDMTSLFTSKPPEAFANFATCMASCSSTDVNCSMGCLSDNGLIPGGGTFQLRMNIDNSTAGNIEIIIDAGTWFNPDSTGNQPMMVIFPIHIIIVPGTGDYNIPVYCLANEKHAPSTDSDTYNMCDLVSTSSLAQIVDITKTKDIEGLNFTDLSRVQTMIWDATQGVDIQQADWDFLNGLL